LFGRYPGIDISPMRVIFAASSEATRNTAFEVSTGLSYGTSSVIEAAKSSSNVVFGRMLLAGAQIL
jgi:hypothetical protein